MRAHPSSPSAVGSVRNESQGINPPWSDSALSQCLAGSWGHFLTKLLSEMPVGRNMAESWLQGREEQQNEGVTPSGEVSELSRAAQHHHPPQRWH